MKTLAYPLALVQMDREDYTTHQKQRYLQYIILAYRKMKLHGQLNVSVAYLTPNAVLNSVLPGDYVNWTKVGFMLCGKLITLSVNNDLIMEDRYDECGDEYSSALTCASDECNSIEVLSGIWGGTFEFASHYRGNNFVGEMYGAGGGWNNAGYFNVNKQLGLIQFSPEVPRTEIVLEYISDASDANINTVIPTEMADVLRHHAHWELAEFSKSSTQTDKDNAWGRFNAAYQEHKDIILLPTIEEYLESSWATYKSSPKR